jgi:hypothetical protein
MPQIHADTESESAIAYHTVFCWNTAHDKKKLFKHYGTNLRQAEVDVDALRKYGIDAELTVETE